MEGAAEGSGVEDGHVNPKPYEEPLRHYPAYNRANPLEPFSVEAGPSRTLSSQNLASEGVEGAAEGSGVENA